MCFYLLLTYIRSSACVIDASPCPPRPPIYTGPWMHDAPSDVTILSFSMLSIRISTSFAQLRTALPILRRKRPDFKLIFKRFCQNAFASGALPRTPLGPYSAPRPPAGKGWVTYQSVPPHFRIRIYAREPRTHAHTSTSTRTPVPAHMHTLAPKHAHTRARGD